MENEPEIEKPQKELRPASLYSIWEQKKGGSTMRFIVKWVALRAGMVERYDLLSLFDRQESSLTPERFEELIEKGVLVEWRV